MKINYVGKCLLIESRGGKKILVIGDLHLGYEESLNYSGVFVARGIFDELISEFDEVFAAVGRVDEVVLLGDVKHNFGKIMKQEWNEISRLFEYLGKNCGRIILVRGNHDKVIAPIAARAGNIAVKDFYIGEKFAFLHGDRDFDGIYDEKIKFWVLGHGHPAVRISDGTKTEKYKCFLAGRFLGRKIIILPSFFSAFAGSDAREGNLGLAWDFKLEKFDVFVVGENLEVLGFGRLDKI